MITNIHNKIISYSQYFNIADSLDTYRLGRISSIALIFILLVFQGEQ